MKAKGSGLQGRIADFFAANPDEYLTIMDAVTKWDATADQIRGAVYHLRAWGQPLRIIDGVLMAEAE